MSFASLLLIVCLSFALGMAAGISLYRSVRGWLDNRKLTKAEKAWRTLETC